MKGHGLLACPLSAPDALGFNQEGGAGCQAPALGGWVAPGSGRRHLVLNEGSQDHKCPGQR